MQSRISSFNPTLFRKNLTRFWPIWGMASFIGVLCPLILFMTAYHTPPAPSPEPAAEVPEEA